jgi:hypothetical protein
MLPQSYQIAGAVVLAIGGLLACFAGYRLFRIVLTVYGFIFGAAMASSVMGTSNTGGMIVAALAGGSSARRSCSSRIRRRGAGGRGAGRGRRARHLSGIGGDPHPLIVVAFDPRRGWRDGAQRYVIIVGTSLGGRGRSSLARWRWAATVPRRRPSGNVWIRIRSIPTAARWLPMWLCRRWPHGDAVG